MKSYLHLISEDFPPFSLSSSKKRVWIGKSETSDLPLSHPLVKEKHGYLFFEKGTWWIKAKEGKIFLNGKEVQFSPLRSGDLLQLGLQGPLFLISITPLESREELKVSHLEDILRSLSFRLKLLYGILFLLLGLLIFWSPSFFEKQKLRHYEQKMEQLKQKIQWLQKKLEHSRLEKSFQALQKQWEKSVVFIYTEVPLYHPSTQKVEKLISFGTGFAVTPLGHIVTNKHVVQPWKFGHNAEKIATQGYVVLEDSQKIALWRSGEVFRTPKGQLDFQKGYNNFLLRNLFISRVAEDSWTYRRSRSGKTYRVHRDDQRDLLLLRAVGGKWNPIPLASAKRLEKLDPVMILGFPEGMYIIESNVVQASPCLGSVRKVEDNLYIFASFIPGISGAPVLTEDGTAVGICTRVYRQSETLGVCIRSLYILELLPRPLREKLKKNF